MFQGCVAVFHQLSRPQMKAGLSDAFTPPSVVTWRCGLEARGTQRVILSNRTSVAVDNQSLAPWSSPGSVGEKGF